MSKSTLIIAEAGVNHNGDLGLARELIDVAADAGADVVKFQTFSAATIVTKNAGKADYQKKATGADESQQAMLAKLELPYKAHFELQAHAEKRGIEFLSSPFDDDAVRFLLDELKLKRIKIPSGEITNAPLLLRIAERGTKSILSTGMSDLTDIENALGVLAYGYLKKPSTAASRSAFSDAFHSVEGLQALKENVILLHCTSDYPAKFEQINLNAMKTIEAAFGLPTGYSDHTDGTHVSVAAAALGAVCIEKHFTTDKNLPGPDHKASLNPAELKELVRGIRETDKALGYAMKRPQPGEISTRKVARKSIVAARPIEIGEVFSKDNLVIKRPGTGLSPMNYWSVVGQKATRAFQADELIQLESGR